MTWRDYLEETLRTLAILAFGAGLAVLVMLTFTHDDGKPLSPTTAELRMK